MANSLEKTDQPLAQKLGHALNRVQVAMRADSWENCGQNDLNPTQGQILIVLGGRTTGLRLSEIASELAVSAPTVSESVATLVEKGYVKKGKAIDDGRAVTVTLSAAGKRIVERLDVVGGAITTVLESLPVAEQIQLYRTMLRMVRQLQAAGRIPVSRMCVTCRYFRPNVHNDAKRPHHCALVDAAFGDQTLRSDCPEHEAADEHLAAKNWETFTSESAIG
ncbi:MAG: MarR family winged helix-turn-helix transcriptional regulator [Planctomycetota bacterium]|nr:MarR family winged helix-turn-helix transcriptional regulator [Planctomycetota bacterium]MDA1179199.1 MarR family winged helix-turn-helix transcriptional regulator [Planctomycetota bacterium]